MKFKDFIPNIKLIFPAIKTIVKDIGKTIPDIKNRASETHTKPEEVLDHIVDTYSSTRIGLGIVGILFPLILWWIGLLLGVELQGSISDYYHTPMRNAFVGILFIVGASLYLYKGYSTEEDFILDAAGICAVGIALFPTACSGGLQCDPFTRPSLHFISAISFFFLIAYICICKASDTLNNNLDLVRKKIQVEHYKEVYKWLGLGMIVLPTFAAVWLYFVGETGSLVFWVELAGIWVFAAYWIVKTVEINTSKLESFLKDLETTKRSN
jgi:hypothetical protein